MATEKSRPPGLSQGLLGALLRTLEVRPRAQLVAQQAAELLSDATAVLYLVEEDQENQFWSAKATAGEVHLDAAVIPLESGTLGVLAEHRETILFAGNELAREDYAHFHTVKHTCTNVTSAPKPLGVIIPRSTPFLPSTGCSRRLFPCDRCTEGFCCSRPASLFWQSPFLRTARTRHRWAM